MTTGSRTLGLIGNTIHIAPVILAALLAASFLTGILVISLLTTSRAGQQSATTDLVMFDAVKFRAEERAAFQPAPLFDAVKFRAEERAAQP